MNDIKITGPQNLPKLARLDNSYRFKRLVLKLTGFGAALGVIGVLVAAIWGRPILLLLYNETVAELHVELVLVAIVALLRYCYAFLGTALTAMRLFVSQTIMQLCGVSVVAVLGIALIPVFGTVGAVVAMLTGATVVGLMHVAVLYKKVSGMDQKGQRG